MYRLFFNPGSERAVLVANNCAEKGVNLDVHISRPVIGQLKPILRPPMKRLDSSLQGVECVEVSRPGINA